jgi:hypothetical protein
LRAAYPAGRELPVKVLDLAEFDLHLDLVPVNGTAAEWFDYISAIPEVEYGWVEWQVCENTGHPTPCPVRRNRAGRFKTVVDSD